VAILAKDETEKGGYRNGISLLGAIGGNRIRVLWRKLRGPRTTARKIGIGIFSLLEQPNNGYVSALKPKGAFEVRISSYSKCQGSVRAAAIA